MSIERISRRDLLRCSGVALLGASASGWMRLLADEAVRQGVKKKSVILLYMNGGASHVDTFDPKPGQTEFKTIPTATPGLQFAEHLPTLAKLSKEMAVIRSMNTSEGSHARARYYIHTGYREGVGGVVHPTLGSIMSATVGVKKPELPNFVSISGGGLGPGFLGPVHAPLHVNDPNKGIDNLKPVDSFDQFDDKASVLAQMEQSFLERKKTPAAVAHQATYEAALKLMHSEKAKAFDLNKESESSAKMYGSSKFGRGCLLARRLVEFGVPFVEVDMGGWDTHKDNFGRVKNLSAQLDQGMGGLIADLKQRGLLDSTLVVWMGDFGRTPDVKAGGRGHYPKAWTTILAGGGLKTGGCVGKTDERGATIVDRRVGVNDFLATICLAVGVDPTKDFNTRTGRPIRIVDKGEKPIIELLG
jgi:uncharacterized protein (DUF1501 family)